MSARWWCVEANGRACGRVLATEAEMREAFGPYVMLHANGLALVLAKPRKAQS